MITKIEWIEKNFQKHLAVSKIVCTFATAFREMHFTRLKFYAEIAQLVEHNLAKVGVAGPSPVFRSHSVTGEEHARACLEIMPRWRNW